MSAEVQGQANIAPADATVARVIPEMPRDFMSFVIGRLAHPRSATSHELVLTDWQLYRESRIFDGVFEVDGEIDGEAVKIPFPTSGPIASWQMYEATDRYGVNWEQLMQGVHCLEPAGQAIATE